LRCIELRFSIIIPVLNEEKNIESIINNIEKIKGDFEVVFVDGGSSDNTVNIIGDRYNSYEMLWVYVQYQSKVQTNSFWRSRYVYF